MYLALEIYFMEILEQKRKFLTLVLKQQSQTHVAMIHIYLAT